MKSYAGEGYVFAVLGPGLVVGCSYWLWATLRFQREAVRAAGVVVANEKSGGRYGSESSPQFSVPNAGWAGMDGGVAGVDTAGRVSAGGAGDGAVPA